MNLVLINGERVPVNRLNCGYEFQPISGTGSRNWNVYPEDVLREHTSGAFVIAKWGSRHGEEFEKFIPLKNVVFVENDGVPYEPYEHLRR